MKWDIDKALALLEDPGTSGTSLDRILIHVADAEGMKRLGLKFRKTGGYAIVWALGLGKLAQRKIFFHGKTIHEAYLKARRAVKKMSATDRAWYGIPTPKKRSNSYASARRKAKPRKKSNV
jgi:hypothetical protein